MNAWKRAEKHAYYDSFVWGRIIFAWLQKLNVQSPTPGVGVDSKANHASIHPVAYEKTTTKNIAL